MTTYKTIDLFATGQLLKETMLNNNYCVKQLQEYLCLSCPQTIYKWFRGESLPSVDLLYMMSKLFDVHMEDLIVTSSQELDIKSIH